MFKLIPRWLRLLWLNFRLWRAQRAIERAIAQTTAETRKKGLPDPLYRFEYTNKAGEKESYVGSLEDLYREMMEENITVYNVEIYDLYDN